MVSADAVPTNATLAARLTAPGAEFEIVERLVRGIPTRVYAGGPRTVPTHVVFSDQPLPRTPSGKVLKRELRGPAAAEVSAFPQPSRPGAGHVG